MENIYKDNHEYSFCHYSIDKIVLRKTLWDNIDNKSILINSQTNFNSNPFNTNEFMFFSTPECVIFGDFRVRGGIIDNESYIFIYDVGTANAFPVYYFKADALEKIQYEFYKNHYNSENRFDGQINHYLHCMDETEGYNFCVIIQKSIGYGGCAVEISMANNSALYSLDRKMNVSFTGDDFESLFRKIKVYKDNYMPVDIDFEMAVASEMRKCLTSMGINADEVIQQNSNTQDSASDQENSDTETSEQDSD